MPISDLTVKLTGTEDLGGGLLFGDFRDYCGGLAVCLRKVESVVSGKNQLRYLISDLKSGSIALALRPLPPQDDHDTGDEVVKLFVETVSGLEDGRTVDPRFTREDLKAFRKLAEPLNRRLSEIRIAGKQITTRFIANVDSLIGASIPSNGSVTGRLERLNLHNHRNEFALYPPIEGFVVICTFPEGMTDKVIAAMNRTVTVTGHLAFKPDSPFPEKVQVESMEIHPPDDKLPRLSELRGLLQGALGEMTSVDFINSKRNE